MTNPKTIEEVSRDYDSEACLDDLVAKVNEIVAVLNDRLTPPEQSYSHLSHSHCWDQEEPACGIPLEKHTQCCLCDMKPGQKP